MTVTVLPVPGPHDPEWWLRGRCAEVDSEIFFPEKGASTRRAKLVCRGCEVRAECLEYALTRGEEFGVWGGMSERQRRALKRGTERQEEEAA